MAISSPPPANPSGPEPARLLDRVRDCIRVRHYSVRTEKSYVDWIRRYIRYHGRRHPQGPGRGARGCVPVLPGYGPAGGCADAEPGVGRVAIPLPECPRCRVAVDGGGGTG